MVESENIVAETAERIFADLADAQTINRDSKGGWKAPLWQALTDAGDVLSAPQRQAFFKKWAERSEHREHGKRG